MWIFSLNWQPESISTLLAKEQDKKEIQEGLIKACDVIDLIIEILQRQQEHQRCKSMSDERCDREYQIQVVRFHRKMAGDVDALQSARLQQSWKCVCIS